MRELTIWHNPRCSKSRQTLALLQEAGAKVTILRYLDSAPALSEITDMFNQLGLTDPRDMMRRGEAIYRELGLKTETKPEALLAAMAEHGILIERPIVSNGRRAVIGRPPESVKDLL